MEPQPGLGTVLVDKNGYFYTLLNPLPVTWGGGAISATVQGMGTPGVPVGGVLSVQGVPGGFPFSFTPARPAVGITTVVPANIASVTLLAANVNRLGATITNDSNAVLYLKLGAVASAVSYTVRLVGRAYYEVPYGYTGVIDGIWTVALGDARVTELT